MKITLQANYFISFLMLALMTGCTVGQMSQTRTFSGNETITLTTSHADILNVISEVGKTLKYEVSYLNKQANAISLTTSSSLASNMMLGKYTQASIAIRVSEDGKKLDVQTNVMGNMGSGGEETATKVFEAFKVKLLERIGQSH